MGGLKGIFPRFRLKGLTEALRRRLEGLPLSPAPERGEKDFPSAAERLAAYRAQPRETAGDASGQPLPDRERGEALVYSIDLSPETEAEMETEMEKQIRDEEALRRKTFSSRLVRLVEERGVRPSAFYRAAGIDRKLFSAIRCDACYQPSRETAIRCCLALRLNAEETRSLMASAGYALSDAKRADLIILGCITRGVFDVNDVNAVLDALGEKTFR